MPDPRSAPSPVDPARSAAKGELRRRLLAARARLAASDAATEAAALARHGVRLLERVGADGRPPTVAGYVSLPGEPGTGPLREALRRSGARVLLPVVAGSGAGPGPAPLRWADDPGDEALVVGPFGIRQPGARASEGLLAAADLVLLPALAVDRTGARLGRGGGFYDRAIAMAQTHALLAAVVHPDEVLDTVPVEPHDRPVHAALTRDGVTWLGNARAWFTVGH